MYILYIIYIYVINNVKMTGILNALHSDLWTGFYNNLLFFAGLLSKCHNLSNGRRENGSQAHFQYKFDILHLKAEFEFLDLFYSSYRKPGSFFLMKPADGGVFVCFGVCVCARLQSGR